MQINKTPLAGIFTIQLKQKQDERGYFARTFCKKELKENGLSFNIVQINQSLTKQKGTLRGMHYQTKPKEEKKIVQCIQGKIYDVVININPKSKEYGKYFATELSEENKQLLYIPEGFAHGFQTLTNNCLVQYSMSEYYAPEYASGVAWNDPFFKISWPITNPTMSEKDNLWPFI